jgi:hypothetical protein
MEHDSDEIQIQTSDNKIFTVNVKISNIVDLIKNLTEDYSMEQIIKLDKIDSTGFQKVLDFCKLINYEKLSLPKPFLNVEKIKREHLSQAVINFYSSLTSKQTSEYLELSDFLNIPSLEDLLLLKLIEIFQKESKVIEFFEKEDPNIAEKIKITKEDEERIREKYIIYCEKYVESLTDEQIEELLLEN